MLPSARQSKKRSATQCKGFRQTHNLLMMILAILMMLIISVMMMMFLYDDCDDDEFSDMTQSMSKSARQL